MHFSFEDSEQRVVFFYKLVDFAYIWYSNILNSLLIIAITSRWCNCREHKVSPVVELAPYSAWLYCDGSLLDAVIKLNAFRMYDTCIVKGQADAEQSWQIAAFLSVSRTSETSTPQTHSSSTRKIKASSYIISSGILILVLVSYFSLKTLLSETDDLLILLAYRAEQHNDIISYGDMRLRYQIFGVFS